MKSFLLFITLLIGWSAEAFSGASATRNPKEPHRVVLRNALLEVEIDLSRGARVSSFRYAGFNREEIIFDYQRDSGGLFKDLWTTQGWPGEFDRREYEATIVSSGPERAEVTTRTRVTGTFRNKTDPTLEGLELRKTFRLDQGSRVLQVEVEVENPTDTGRRFSYWVQNALDFDGTRKNALYWRPVRHGVDVIGLNRKSEYHYWYTAVPRAGWNGVSDPNLARGVLFYFDYNAVEQLYDNVQALTAEWMYDPVAVPPRRTWKTRMQIVPTEGFTGYTHADDACVAHFRFTETPAGLVIWPTLAARDEPLRQVRMETKLLGVSGDWEAEGTPLELAEIGRTPATPELRIVPNGAIPAILRTTLSWDAGGGKRRQSTFEAYYGGAVGRNLSLELLEPLHEFAAPPKEARYLKPDRIALTNRSGKPRILFIRGLWADFQGVDEAIARLGEVEVVSGWMKKESLGETVGNFPGSYDELLQYDLIILGNVSGPMLGALGQEMLADFAKAGGGLLFLSGDRTYGQAAFSNDHFTALLPATFRGGGDYERLATPARLVAPAQGGLPGAFPATPNVKYLHHVNPREDALTLLALDNGQPAIVANPKGKPRIALVTILPFGKDDAKAPLYFRQPQWHETLAQLIRTLLPAAPSKP